MRTMFGLLNFCKPPEWTSRQVVDVVQRLVRPDKTGHAGTLDPLATGVLVVCVGQATRLIPFIQEQPKEYLGTFQLGVRSNTDDVTGELMPASAPVEVTRREIEAVLPQFVGTIRQVPPKFSAVHVNGQRAYKLARRGADFEIAAKQVQVYRVELTAFQPPFFTLRIECGSGTYIRSIGRDIGELLGCGAVMTELERTRIGGFTREAAVSPDEVTWESLATHLLPAVDAVPEFPTYSCTADDCELLHFGRSIPCPHLTTTCENQAFALLSTERQLVALARFEQQDGAKLVPTHVFSDVLNVDLQRKS